MHPILVVDGSITPAAVAALCDRVTVVSRLAAGEPVVCDVSALVDPSALALDTLVRLQLVARRSGTSICLRDAPPALVDLLALAGLTALLPVVDRSGIDGRSGVDGRFGVDPDRQIEEREQAGIDEEVDSREARA